MSSNTNIVLMYADDMGYGDFGAFNDGYVRTPNLDQLISESLCLSQHYTGSPVCSPSRAALLTGRYPHRTGAVTPQETRGMDRIHTSEITVGDVFKSAGYATGMVGKWHNGALDPRYHPNARGFDEFVGFRGGWADYYDWNLDVNGSVRTSDGRYLTDVLGDEAVDFIRRHSSEPFLLMVPFNAPHSPLQAPDDVTFKYEDMGLNRGVSLTYAMIEVMDRAVGRILETLDELGLSGNTIVMFTSDNGPAFMLRDDQVPEGVSIDTTRYNCGYNGAKGSAYEGGIHVPMIVRWPDGLPEGHHEVSELVHYTDWLPTLMSATGVERPDGPPLDGNDVLAQLRGEQPWDEPRRFWQWNDFQPIGITNAAMRDGDWKLVRPRIDLEFATPEDAAIQRAYVERDIEYKYHPERVTGLMTEPDPERIIPEPPTPELYNIADDPLEQNSVADAHPERTRQMLRELETWFEQVDAERAIAHQETLRR